MQDFSALLEKQGATVVAWYLAHGRDLPWRHTNDAYAVWLSEVVLQQTRVDQGTAYWHRLLAAFPTVQHLAAADEQSVLKVWEGLGYYTRARNLHKTAQVVASQHAGVFPASAEGLQALPGIGPYTARAVASLVWGERVAVLDGNVFRVLARAHADETPIDKPVARAHYQALADAWLGSANDPAAFNQGIMDLGATVCTPRNPQCNRCPLQSGCTAHKLGRETDFPVKAGKMVRKEQFWEVYHAPDEHGNLPWVQRTGKGVWQGLWFLPHQPVDAFKRLPKEVELLGMFQHEFSHYRLQGRVLGCTATWLQLHHPALTEHARWCSAAHIALLPKPRAWAKVLQLVHVPQPELFSGAEPTS